MGFLPSPHVACAAVSAALSWAHTSLWGTGGVRCAGSWLGQTPAKEKRRVWAGVQVWPWGAGGVVGRGPDPASQSSLLTRAPTACLLTLRVSSICCSFSGHSDLLPQRHWQTSDLCYLVPSAPHFQGGRSWGLALPAAVVGAGSCPPSPPSPSQGPLYNPGFAMTPRLGLALDSLSCRPTVTDACLVEPSDGVSTEHSGWPPGGLHSRALRPL